MSFCIIHKNISNQETFFPQCIHFFSKSNTNVEMRGRNKNSLHTFSQKLVQLFLPFSNHMWWEAGEQQGKKKSQMWGLKIHLSYRLDSIKQTLVHLKCENWSGGWVAIRNKMWICSSLQQTQISLMHQIIKMSNTWSPLSFSTIHRVPVEKKCHHYPDCFKHLWPMCLTNAVCSAPSHENWHLLN